jgi:hypothetical protein
MPAIDQNFCQSWTPQDLGMYNSLPVWMMLREQRFRKKYGNFKRIFGTIDWEANKGSTMTGVVVEPPPTLRQFAFPNALSTRSNKDVIQHRERTFTFSLKAHKFESPAFQWLASFQDFVKQKITKNLEFVLKWQEEFMAQFYRGYMFHQAPTIMWAGHKTTVIDDLCPQGDGNVAGTSGKSNAYLAGKVVDVLGTANLSLQTLAQALNYLDEDSLAVPYQSGTANDDSFLNDKYLLMTSSEAYNNFINDPFLKEMKTYDLEVIKDGFKGSLFGRITTALHSNPLRMAVATDGTISWPAPETTQEDAAADNFGQTIRNPAYRTAQYEVAFLCGAQGYSIVNPGAPPTDFTSDGQDRLRNLMWNGKPRLTDQVNVPCTTDSAATVYEPNTYGEFLKIISLCVMGIAGETKRNVLPIIFKRARTITNTLI